MNATMNQGLVQVNTTTDLTYLVKYSFTDDWCLIIDLGQNFTEGEQFSLQIFYTTQNTGEGMQWLTPNQTFGGVYPFMYTACKMTNCRTVAPMMDTPSTKQTYGACILAPSNLTVYMSANQTGIYYDRPGSYKTCFFNSLPIPSYLVAMVIGNLEYKATGIKTGIIAEPEIMQKAEDDLKPVLEIYLNNVEAYMQLPYLWGTYNVVIMPPSYPFGGVENPMMTFASPTILTASGQQNYVIIHEMAHQWAGNVVTMNNWEDFWINEGVATYIERRVTATVFNETFSFTEALIGNFSLEESVNTISMVNPTYATLHPVLAGDDPDNSYSVVPFEKGFQFMLYLQNQTATAGTNWIHTFNNMQDFITYFVYNNQFTSIDQYGFRQIVESFIALYSKKVPSQPTSYGGWQINQDLQDIDWNWWMYEVGFDQNLDFWNPQSL